MQEPPRSPRRRYSLRITIGSVVVGLLVAVVLGVLAIALVVRERTRQVTVDSLVGEVSRGISQAVEDRVTPAGHLLSEMVGFAERGFLPVEDPAALVERLGERMRHDQRYEWLAYVQGEELGAGALRRPDGSMLLLSQRRGEEPRQEVLRPDGTREPATSGFKGLGALEQVPWRAYGEKSQGPVWTPPYQRPVDGAWGRACALAWRRDGKPVGVFGLGFGLAFAGEAVAHVWGDRPGAVAFLLQGGRIGATSAPEVAGRFGSFLQEVAASGEGGLEGLGDRPRTVVRTHEGESWVVTLRRLTLAGGLDGTLALLVPEERLVGYFSQYGRWGILGAGVLLLLSTLLAARLAGRISKPLRAIADDLGRVGSFDLTDRPAPASRLAEVAVVADATDRMKKSLRSFGRYVPTALVRDLLGTGQEARLDGRLRPLTLFFSDVEGFTSVSEGMAPQALVDALGDYLDVVTGALSRGGGTIDKFMGDGVLAFFNAPHDDPEHPARACRAALAVQAALGEALPRWQAADQPAFRTRIGLHTAEVVVGNIGTPERFAYTVIGDGVNLAARLESLNKAYGTWIMASEATRRAAGDGFVWRLLDRTAVKGRSGGSEVYELLGVAGAVDAPRLAARDAYEAALAAYFARRFEEAARGFDGAARARPGDKAAALLAARARAYAATPPPPTWDGVAVQTEK